MEFREILLLEEEPHEKLERIKKLLQIDPKTGLCGDYNKKNAHIPQHLETYLLYPTLPPEKIQRTIELILKSVRDFQTYREFLASEIAKLTKSDQDTILKELLLAPRATELEELSQKFKNALSVIQGVDDFTALQNIINVYSPQMKSILGLTNINISRVDIFGFGSNNA